MAKFSIHFFFFCFYQNSIAFSYPAILKTITFSQIELLNSPQRRRFCSSKFKLLKKIVLQHVKQLDLDANNPVFGGSDQPGPPRRLISAFVFRILESIIFNLAANETSFFQLVSMAEKTGLSLASSCRKPQRQVLSRRGLIHLKIIVRFRPQTV